MHEALIGIVAACGLIATAAPILARPYTQASTEKASQQTASAQDASTTRTP